MNPSISVIVPTHNTRDLTLRCLESIARGSKKSPEVILVDDGSTDDTVDRVREQFPTAQIVDLVPSRGFTTAVNAGLQAASGELLFLLNSDAELAPDTLKRIAEAFALNPRLGVGGGVLRFPDGRPQWSAGAEPSMLWMLMLATGATGLLERLPGYRILRPLEAAKRSRVDWVSGAAMTIRRSAWREGGALDERFRFYCQDLDYCLRLRDLGWEVAIIPEANVLHHGGATIGRRAGSVQAGFNPELLWGDLVRFFEKRHGPEQARFVAKWLRRGGWLRIKARLLAEPFLCAEQREHRRLDTVAFIQAIKGLSTW
jgi:N-acetylglucosaminyl-diphospho-decaprenol L-rhamnosyltransferase